MPANSSCRLSSPRRRQRVYLEARKSVPGADGRPTQLPNEIEDVFPLVRPTWDYDTAAGQAKGAPDYPAPDLETPGSCLPPRRCNRPTPVPDR
ncbi:Gag polyprotein [Vulpes lagopus]